MYRRLPDVARDFDALAGAGVAGVGEESTFADAGAGLVGAVHLRHTGIAVIACLIGEQVCTGAASLRPTSWNLTEFFFHDEATMEHGWTVAGSRANKEGGAGAPPSI